MSLHGTRSVAHTHAHANAHVHAPLLDELARHAQRVTHTHAHANAHGHAPLLDELARYAQRRADGIGECGGERNEHYEQYGSR